MPFPTDKTKEQLEADAWTKIADDLTKISQKLGKIHKKRVIKSNQQFKDYIGQLTTSLSGLATSIRPKAPNGG